MTPDNNSSTPPPVDPQATGTTTTNDPAADAAPGAERAATGTEREKKERVIHTRVPAVLEAELKRFAENLHVPVSNLIRTILEDAVAVADKATESVERELRTAASRVNNEREKLRRSIARPDPLEGVYGFQPLMMNVHSKCAKCSAPLEPGADAHLALSDREGPRQFVCPSCLPGRKPAG
ncbi:MAG: hypothetical protein WCJ30_10845 [Deltaproteobacteria bacterium]